MRRPHVYERSVLRARRDACQVPDTDPGRAVRAIIRALPALIAAARAEAERTGQDPAP